MKASVLIAFRGAGAITVGAMGALDVRMRAILSKGLAPALQRFATYVGSRSPVPRRI